MAAAAERVCIFQIAHSGAGTNMQLAGWLATLEVPLTILALSIYLNKQERAAEKIVSITPRPVFFSGGGDIHIKLIPCLMLKNIFRHFRNYLLTSSAYLTWEGGGRE